MDDQIKLLQQQLQRSLLAIRKLKEENSRLGAVENEAVAIVGMGFKLPEDNDSAIKFWETLINGNDDISEIPVERWDPAEYYDSNPDAENKYYTNQAGTIKRSIKEFDPVFFNISPSEARYMDPQQRLLLEACWEAFENANIPPDLLMKSETGVFIGMSSFDNAIRLNVSGAPISAYTGTGNALSGGAGRIAHTFGFNGPVMNIDTACSSSLVAIHQACKSIRNKECSVAVVGGVNVLLSPEVMVNFCQSKMLAVDGRCKTFDEAANGYARGEGVGVIILKPLSKALQDKDSILALIKGSAVNHDGKSAGLTVPNGLAQQFVMKKALADARLNPEDISYIECHGTGTSLGDPIEFEAIANVYGNRSAANALHIGSLKTNIGHLEAAAGIAGLIKVILCIQHKKIVPHLHFKNPSKFISWNKFPQIKVPVNPVAWTGREEDHTLRAGISSFGFTGTNSHIIVEEYNKEKAGKSENGQFNAFPVLTFSAKSKTALLALQKKYIHYLEKKSAPIADVCYSSNIGRNHFQYRFAVAGANYEQLKDLLSQKTVVAEPGSNSQKIAFLFTGQGSQYTTMGKELFDSNLYFREKIMECSQLLEGNLDIPLIELLFNAEQEFNLNQTQYAQPAIFAIEYAMASLWMHWGVQPSLLLGHSIGELTAACIAGIFNLGDAIKLVLARGKLMQAATGDGVMYSVNISGERLTTYIKDRAQISIAAINGPEQSVLSGDRGQAAQIIDQLQQDGYTVSKLNVSHAFHSPLMEKAKNEFLEILQQVKFNIPSIPIISNLNGDFLKDEMCKPDYWADQIVNPVDFYSCIKTLEKLDIDSCIEMGPSPVLLSLIANSRVNLPALALLTSFKKTGSTWVHLSKSVAVLYEKGINLNWERINQEFITNKISLPNYSFQLEPYWVEGKRKRTDYLSKNIAKEIQQDIPDDLSKLLSNVNLVVQELPVPFLSKAKHWILISFVKTDTDSFQKYLSLQGDSSQVINIGNLDEESIEDDIYQRITQISFDQESYYLALFLPSDSAKMNKNFIDQFSNTGLGFIFLIRYLEERKTLLKIKSIAIVHIKKMLLAGTYDGDESTLIGKSFMALGRVVENELVNIPVKRITTEKGRDTEDYNDVYNEIISTVKESDIILTQEKRSILRIQPFFLNNPPERRKEEVFMSEKSYLIIGGLGALGLHVAAWAVENKAKHIFLVSRSGIPKNELNGLLEELKSRSVHIHTLKADVADALQMEQLFFKFGTEFPALGGVFYLAGTLADCTILNETQSNFNSVLKPKVVGIWNIERLMRNLKNVFFVQFSSLSSIFGTPGQANYAYANGFLDAMAEFRIARGLPCLNINWGPWEGDGMAAGFKNNLSGSAVHKLSIKQGINILDYLMKSQYSGSVCAGEFNTEVIKRLDIPLLEEFLSSDKEDTTTTTTTTEHTQIQDLKTILSEILELPVDQFDENTALINYGFDSLLALKAKREIYKVSGIDLDMNVFMNSPTVKQLKIILTAELEKKQVTDSNVLLQDADEEFMSIDNLSEAEIDNLLDSLNKSKDHGA